VSITATMINPVASVEERILDFSDAVISDANLVLSSLVLVVRLIINGRVAVGGFARS
jgi:hypothetical protein